VAYTLNGKRVRKLTYKKEMARIRKFIGIIFSPVYTKGFYSMLGIKLKEKTKFDRDLESALKGEYSGEGSNSGEASVSEQGTNRASSN
jgi:hypothetical protein